MRKPKFETLTFDKFVPGGQALGTSESGKKIFAWGVLPNETAKIQITKSKSTFAEGFIAELLKSSSKRIEPQDGESYLSTSPWQIMDFNFEQEQKDKIITEAFMQNNLPLTQTEPIFTDGNIFNYRNKVEFSFWWEKIDEDSGELKLAFFRRGGRGKIPVDGTSLARNEINQAATRILKVLRSRKSAARDLKTLLIRCNQAGQISAQLYVKELDFEKFSANELEIMDVLNFQLIFSNPKSPASVITKRLQNFGEENLSDSILDIDFNYATESFFQINIPVYEAVLKDMRRFIDTSKATIDLYSGVGSIGLTIGENSLTMVEINESAVEEMKRNITSLNRESSVQAILAASENALEYIKSNSNLIVDPPRAGMDKTVCATILEKSPRRIIYLSCNPITQARDAAILSEKYNIVYSRAYNFFPRTPHIENLLVLELK